MHSSSGEPAASHPAPLRSTPITFVSFAADFPCLSPPPAPTLNPVAEPGGLAKASPFSLQLHDRRSQDRSVLAPCQERRALSQLVGPDSHPDRRPRPDCSTPAPKASAFSANIQILRGLQCSTRAPDAAFVPQPQLLANQPHATYPTGDRHVTPAESNNLTHRWASPPSQVLIRLSFRKYSNADH